MHTPAPFNPELQALALCTGKTYLHQLPQLSRQPIEVFLDIEGIPDRDFYYLIGLLVVDGRNASPAFLLGQYTTRGRGDLEEVSEDDGSIS